MVPGFRIALALSIAVPLMSLPATPGCCKRGAGVTVTKEVPHSRETLSDIGKREKANPLPARGDIAIHSHKIPRPGGDNTIANHPGADNAVK